MENRGYIHKGISTINETNPNITTFPVKIKSIGKILILECPNNQIISACGITHEGGCQKLYSIDIKCLNNENKQPFQNLHYPVIITNNYHIVAEIVVTKLLTKEADKGNATLQNWLENTNPILRAVAITNSFEYLMWNGVYKFFSKEFLNTSFNLYPNEKMIFYAINPDMDITKIKFELKADILEYKGDPNL